MKKFISLVLIPLMVTMLLGGCSGSGHSEVSKANIPTKIQSAYLSDWNDVAACSYATEEQLVTVARRICEVSYRYLDKKYWIKTISRNLCENPSSTGKVIKRLAYSNNYAVVNMAAQSTHANEEALLAIAMECAEIPKSREDWATAIAKSICESNSATGNVFKKLANSNFSTVNAIAHEKLEELHQSVNEKEQMSEAYTVTPDVELTNVPTELYDDLNTIAASETATEAQLIEISRKCAAISDSSSDAETIARKICNNPASTSAVIRELSNAHYCSVLEIAARSKLANEAILVAIAKRIFTDQIDESEQFIMAAIICNNSNTTGTVTRELLNSPYELVWITVAECPNADEETLIELVKRSMTIYSDGGLLGKSIRNNPASTAKVLRELEKS